MADKLVTGIAQTSDPQILENALANKPGVEHERLTVITKESPTDRHADSVLTFMHVGQEHTTSDLDHNVIAGGTSILTNISEPQVPNISSDNRYIGFFAEPHIIDHLSAYPIPEDQVQNYNDAIEEGRSVVLYKTGAAEAPAAEQTFKEAGLKNVKTFEGPTPG